MTRFPAVLFAVWLSLTAGARAQDAAARGRYLAILGDCAGCHTPPHGPAFAGGLPFNAPFGTIYSTNITPDRETGIGNWSEEDFYRALHDGIAPAASIFIPPCPISISAASPGRTPTTCSPICSTLTPVHRRPRPTS